MVEGRRWKIEFEKELKRLGDKHHLVQGAVKTKPNCIISID